MTRQYLYAGIGWSGSVFWRAFQAELALPHPLRARLLGRSNDAATHQRPRGAMERIRVLYVDAHRLVREGIALLISRASDIEVVALAATAEEAVSEFRAHRPDVTLMDFQLTNMSGVDAIRAIRSDDASARIIVLTVSQNHDDVHRALRAGASICLVKDVTADDLLNAIRDVRSRRQPRTADLESEQPRRGSLPSITPREIQVLELIAQGMRNKEIGATLGITLETVQVHVKNILAKLGVQDRTAAIGAAVRRGLIHLS
jgi:two-component system, NarL family, response regulator